MLTAAALVGLILGLAAGRHAAEGLRVERRAVSLPGLHPDLGGLRLAHLSDLHGRTRTRWGVDLAGLVRVLGPDAVLIGGDLASHPRQLPAMLDLLRRLAAPLGVFLVTGNNDYRLRAPVLAGFLRQAAGAGVTLLDGHHAPLARGGGRLWLAGVPGAQPGRVPPVPRASGEPLILLAHSPEVVPLAARSGVDLLLAGHTHGGQVCLPGWGPLITKGVDRSRARGLWRTGGLQVLISAGVGTSYLPLRAFCPPDVGLVTLHPGEGEGG